MEKPYCRTLEEAHDIQGLAKPTAPNSLSPTATATIPSSQKSRNSSGMASSANPSRSVAGARRAAVAVGKTSGYSVPVLNLARQFSGKLLSCSATLFQDGRPITKDDCREGNEALGTLAGNQLHARYMTESSIPLYFDSIQNHGKREASFWPYHHWKRRPNQLPVRQSPPSLFQKRHPLEPLLRFRRLATHRQGWLPGTDPPPSSRDPRAPQHITACKDLLASIGDKSRLPSATTSKARKPSKWSRHPGIPPPKGQTCPLPPPSQGNPLDAL